MEISVCVVLFVHLSVGNTGQASLGLLGQGTQAVQAGEGYLVKDLECNQNILLETRF